MIYLQVFDYIEYFILTSALALVCLRVEGIFGALGENYSVA